jgi:hypothetical protein
MLCLLLAFWSGPTPPATRGDRPPAGDTQFTPPPGEESTEVSALIDRARAALQAGRTATEVLTDRTFMPVRAWPRFREAIRQSAPVGAVKLVPASEPGDLLRV